MSDKVSTRFLVIGSGPGGYAAAFRLADLTRKESSGQKDQNVVLVEMESFGGTCLNVGCIPSKAYLHMAEIKNSVDEASEHGISYGAPKINREQLVASKKIVNQLSKGLEGLAKQRKVKVLYGKVEFMIPTKLRSLGKMMLS